MYGERVRYIREKMSLSQQQLADRCGIHKQQIYRIENNLADPTGETIKLLARELEVSADYLLGLADEPDRQSITEESIKPIERSLIRAYRHRDYPEIMRIIASM